MTIKSRFAPSPTGDLHLGSARTALFAYLYAKKHNGKYILRIEDTDRERSTDKAINVIFDSLKWLGIESEEPVYFQTKRFDLYKTKIQELLDKNLAYKCFCSKERLEELRNKQLENKEKPKYDGCCRNLSEQELASKEGAEFVIRFKNPTEGSVIFKDLVHGNIEVSNKELDDLIIARTDGTPTYNFTVAVDDSDMEITHVIRGDDHINNTPRQINILEALGTKAPHYAHVPMILGDDGKKLSKRHGAASVLLSREQGYLPEALLNALVRLGWSHGDEEIFSLEQMEKLFDLDHINKSAAILSTEKLLWLNHHYMKTLPFEKVELEILYHLGRANVNIKQPFFPNLEELFNIQKEKCKTLIEFIDSSKYFFNEEIVYDQKSIEKFLAPECIQYLEETISDLENIDESQWNIDPISIIIKSIVKRNNIKFPNLAQPLRVCLTGSTTSPSIDATIYLLGKNRVIKRIKDGIKLIKDFN